MEGITAFQCETSPTLRRKRSRVVNSDLDTAFELPFRLDGGLVDAEPTIHLAPAHDESLGMWRAFGELATR